MSELDRVLESAATAPVLLVACDYDGTLAPIVDDPSAARPNREAIVALRTLGELANTHVAVISGRALSDLAELSGLGEHVRLIGSHGSEFEVDFAGALSREALALRERIGDALGEFADCAPGFVLETKPASVAFHYRNADPGDAERAVRDVLAGPASWEGVSTKRGKKVVELAVVAGNKGTALENVRRRVGASTVVFLGDDVTDEDAFATLAGPDVGVKVGPGETVARHRAADTREVSQILARICELRDAWVAGEEGVPIERFSMLSDQRTVALVTPEASLEWLCLPRIDSPALFASLVGGPAAGRFSIRPADGGKPVRQRYEERSLVLRTEWPELTVTDFLDCSDNRPRQRAGRADLVRVIEGRGRCVVEFAPRLDFGRMPTQLRRHATGLSIVDAQEPIVLRAPRVEWELREEGRHHTAVATIELQGRPVVLDLRYGTGSLGDTRLLAGDRAKRTSQYWSRWCENLSLPAVEPDLVLRSALALKALVYAPTGAISAAGTTSLPEHVGGVRNWDYRYCWLRDAAMAARALLDLDSIDEAMHYLDWVLGIVDRCPAPQALAPLYTVTGAEVQSDAEIGDLSGYRGSRPVRVGNSASQQVQLDVFGPIVDLVWHLLEREAPLSWEHWRLVEAMASAVSRRWSEPDHGIWEVRLPRQHHVHSKVMCWLTLDRAARFARSFLEEERTDWTELAARIRDDVLEYGWNERMRSFSSVYGSTDVDAATLHVGLSGLVEPSDPRFVGTVEAIERELLHGPTVYRYRFDDGLPGHEGGFHICTSWLIDAYVLVGRMDDARALFAELLRLVGPTGLLSEQYGPNTRRALGNHPQAYSHVGLIQNALRLSRAAGA